MKYSLFIILFLHIFIRAMETDKQEFVIDKESVLSELNNAVAYNISPTPYQYIEEYPIIAGLFERLIDLKKLHMNVLKKTDNYMDYKKKHQTREAWEHPHFQNWLDWFEGKINELIIGTTIRGDLYDKTNDTILRYAATNNNYVLLKYILDAGIKPQMCRYNTLYGVTNLTIAKLLIKRGENINKLGFMGSNIITRPHKTKLLQYYLEHGLDAKYHDDGTALHWLAEHHAPCEDLFPNATLLLKHGVPINAINNNNKTALDLILEQIKLFRNTEEKELDLKIGQLLRKHSALTAEELQNQKKIEE